MTAENDKVVVGLKKARTLLERVIRMSEKDDAHLEMIQQNLAVIGLLRSANQRLLEGLLQQRLNGVYEERQMEEFRATVQEISRIVRLASG